MSPSSTSSIWATNLAYFSFSSSQNRPQNILTSCKLAENCPPPSLLPLSSSPSWSRKTLPQDSNSRPVAMLDPPGREEDGSSSCSNSSKLSKWLEKRLPVAVAVLEPPEFDQILKDIQLMLNHTVKTILTKILTCGWWRSSSGSGCASSCSHNKSDIVSTWEASSYLFSTTNIFLANHMLWFHLRLKSNLVSTSSSTNCLQCSQKKHRLK